MPSRGESPGTPRTGGRNYAAIAAIPDLGSLGPTQTPGALIEPLFITDPFECSGEGPEHL
jgi:hypothetical protein